MAAEARLLNARSRHSRERILVAAAELFAENGYDGTSVRMIADAAQITVAGLYAHFPNKAQLFSAVALESLAGSPLSAIAEEAPEPDVIAARLIAAYGSPKERLTRRLAIELTRAAVAHPEVAQALREFYDKVREVLIEAFRRGQRSGSVSIGSSPEDLARFLLILLMGLTHIDALDPTMADNADWHQAMISCVVVGMGMDAPQVTQSKKLSRAAVRRGQR